MAWLKLILLTPQNWSAIVMKHHFNQLFIKTQIS